MKSSITALCVLLLLPSCATLSKNECLTGDWLSIGYTDAAEGWSRERIGEHRQACADYGIAPDFSVYQQGYDQGLVVFCTPRNGFQKGKSGYQYTGICPADMEAGFLQGYDGGREIYEVATEAARLDSELQDLGRHIDAIDSEIDEREHLQVEADMPKDQRRKNHRQIEALREERYDLDYRYRQLLDDKEEVDDRLDFLNRVYRDW